MNDGVRIFACKMHCNGRMIVVALCCHVCGLQPDVAKRIVVAAWMLHGLRFGGEPGQETLCFFRVKWLRPVMKGTCVRRVQLRSKRARSVPPLCSATSGCSCVRSSMRFLTLWLQIAV